MKLFNRVSVAIGTSLLVPFFAFAQTGTPIGGLLEFIKNILNALITLLIIASVVALFIYIFKYIWGGGGADDKAANMKGIWRSLLALGIMLTFFGIIKLVGCSIGLCPGEDPLKNVDVIDL